MLGGALGPGNLLVSSGYVTLWRRRVRRQRDLGMAGGLAASLLSQWLMTHNHKLFYGGRGTVQGLTAYVALAGLSHALKTALLVVI